MWRGGRWAPSVRLAQFGATLRCLSSSYLLLPSSHSLPRYRIAPSLQVGIPSSHQGGPILPPTPPRPFFSFLTSWWLETLHNQRSSAGWRLSSPPFFYDGRHGSPSPSISFYSRSASFTTRFLVSNILLHFPGHSALRISASLRSHRQLSGDDPRQPHTRHYRQFCWSTPTCYLFSRQR